MVPTPKSLLLFVSESGVMMPTVEGLRHASISPVQSRLIDHIQPIAGPSVRLGRCIKWRRYLLVI